MTVVAIIVITALVFCAFSIGWRFKRELRRLVALALGLIGSLFPRE